MLTGCEEEPVCAARVLLSLRHGLAMRRSVWVYEDAWAMSCELVQHYHHPHDITGPVYPLRDTRPMITIENLILIIFYWIKFLIEIETSGIFWDHYLGTLPVKNIVLALFTDELSSTSVTTAISKTSTRKAESNMQGMCAAATGRFYTFKHSAVRRQCSTVCNCVHTYVQRTGGSRGGGQPGHASPKSPGSHVFHVFHVFRHSKSS